MVAGKIRRSLNPFFFFAKKEKEAIVSAIQQAEMRTSGEIRVHLEKNAKKNILSDAQEVFEKIGMTRTEAHNGVLIYLCLKTKEFAIIGDAGIHQKIPEGFWDTIAQALSHDFAEDCFGEGLVTAISKIGEELKTYFPRDRIDVNELPDAISCSSLF